MPSFALRVVAWQRAHGRHDLPWQRTRDAYRVWLSEIMLQQTQVATVIPYFERFVAAFPDVRSLAAAPRDDVLALWSGLGYYRRAHHAHDAARRIVAEHGGVFPRDVGEIAALPGVGRSTAAAIAAFAFGARAPILDGNVRRVLARHRGIDGAPSRIEARLWQAAEALFPARGDVARYTQGLMDLGALVCTRRRPCCGACPVAADCIARIDDRTAELPSPRPRKPLPSRVVGVLVLESASGLLLERRPPTGVWAGLWSLPEFAPEHDARNHCRERFGLDTRAGEPLAPIEHAFTHFRLTLKPQRMAVVAGECAREPGLRWFSRSGALEAGLPAPIRALIAALPETQAPLGRSNAAPV